MSNRKNNAKSQVANQDAMQRQKMTREGWIMLGVTAVACLLPLLLGVRLYDQIPEIVPTSIIGQSGKSDDIPRVVVAFGMPALMCVLDILAHIQINTDPRRLYGPGIIRSICAWGFPVLSVVCCYVFILESAGLTAGLEVYTPLIVGISFLVLGGHFLRCTPESLMALRLPWTRGSRENFIATHRFAAYLWLAMGLALLTVTTLTVTSTWITGAAILVVLLAPLAYSWRTERRNL